MLELCDFCCPNETEALQLINVTMDTKSFSLEECSLSNYIKCLCWLAEKGVRYPMVTMGSEGLVALVSKSSVPPNPTRDVSVVQSIEMKGEVKCVIKLSAPPVPNVIDTTVSYQWL